MSYRQILRKDLAGIKKERLVISMVHTDNIRAAKEIEPVPNVGQ